MSSGSVYGYTTMTAFTTFLWFDTQAEEAAQFYTSIFKNSSIDSVQRYTAAGPGPEGQAMLVEFTINGQPFTGLNGGTDFTFTPAISFVVPCADQAEVDYYWDALLAGGGAPNVCGWLTDQYGLSWQVVPTRFFEMMRDPARAAAVTQAMLTMTKFDIAALEEAYRALGRLPRLASGGRGPGLVAAAALAPLVRPLSFPARLRRGAEVERRGVVGRADRRVFEQHVGVVGYRNDPFARRVRCGQVECPDDGAGIASAMLDHHVRARPSLACLGH